MVFLHSPRLCPLPRCARFSAHVTWLSAAARRSADPSATRHSAARNAAPSLASVLVGFARFRWVEQKKKDALLHTKNTHVSGWASPAWAPSIFEASPWLDPKKLDSLVLLVFWRQKNITQYIILSYGKGFFQNSKSSDPWTGFSFSVSFPGLHHVLRLDEPKRLVLGRRSEGEAARWSAKKTF